MRTITLVTAIPLLSTAVPATIGAEAGEDLRERNLDHLLGELAPGSLEDTTATLKTNAGTETVPSDIAIDAVLDHLDRAQIDLGALFEGTEAPASPAVAGQGSFPLAGTSGEIVEFERAP